MASPGGERGFGKEVLANSRLFFSLFLLCSQTQSEPMSGCKYRFSNRRQRSECPSPGFPWTSTPTPSHMCSMRAAAAAKSLQSCPTLCYPIVGSPPGPAVPGILQARTLEWVAISGKHNPGTLTRSRSLGISVSGHLSPALAERGGDLSFSTPQGAVALTESSQNYPTIIPQS